MRWTPLLIALLVQAALLLWRLDRLPVWGDEQFTLHVAGLPWREIGEALRRDIHPPLYFAFAKLVGADVVRLRAFSALTVLATTLAFDRIVPKSWVVPTSTSEALTAMISLPYSSSAWPPIHKSPTY